MSDAVDAAVRATSTPGAAPPDAETIAAARARAQQMLEEMGGDEAAGLRDLQNLTLSMGLPSTRAVFRQMIKAADVRGKTKAAAMAEIVDFSPVTEVGCMKIDFFNQLSRKPDAAYLLLDQCPKTHDLGAQLEKLKSVVPAEKWAEVLKHLSMLIHIGRSVYGNIARQRLPLIRKIFGLGPDDKCDKYLDLQVDRANTTLYLDADWPHRIGIFVCLEGEVANRRKFVTK